MGSRERQIPSGTRVTGRRVTLVCWGLVKVWRGACRQAYPGARALSAYSSAPIPMRSSVASICAACEGIRVRERSRARDWAEGMARVFGRRAVS